MTGSPLELPGENASDLASRPVPPPGPGLARRLLSGSGWQVMAQITPLFFNLALTPFVIETLGRTGYGLWLVTSTLAQVIATFDGGIGRSAQYFFALLAGTDNRRESTRLLLTLSAAVLFFSCLLIAPAFLLAHRLAEFFQPPPKLYDDTVFLLQVLLVLVAVSLLRNLFAAVLHAYERFALSSVSSLLSYFVYAGGMVWVLSAGMGLRGMAYAFIAQQVVATVTIIPASLRHLTLRGLGFVSTSRLAEIWHVSWRVQISGILTVVSMQAPLLIVARLRPLQVPDFGPGTTFAQQLRLIPMNGVAPIQAILGRSVGRVGAAAARTELVHLQRMWVRGVTGWCVVGAPAAYFGVNVWLPLEGNTAGLVAAVTLLAQWLALMPQVLLQWQLLLGRAEFEMWSSVLTAALLFGSALVLVPLVGAVGAAIAAVIGQLGGLVLLLAVSRLLKVPTPSAVKEIPWVQSIVAGGLSTVLVGLTGRLIVEGRLPDGGLGLLLCAAAAAPALAVFVVTTWGPRRLLRALRIRRTVL